MKIWTIIFFAVSSLCATAEPQVFSASRSFYYSFEDVKASVKTYCAAARTNHPAFSIGGTWDEANRFVQRWIDCAGAPPGALTGEIIVTREAGSITSSRIEVRTNATQPQGGAPAERRREGTKEVLAEIVALLERNE